MSDGMVCTGCGDFAKYQLEVDRTSTRFYYCQKCHDEFIASFDKLPKDRAEAVRSEIRIIELDQS